MSETNVNGAEQPDDGTVMVRRRRRGTGAPRQAAKPTSAFFVLQVLDENGSPSPFPKSRVKLVAVERSAERVLEMVESGEHVNAFYLRGLVPAGRGNPRGQRSSTTA